MKEPYFSPGCCQHHRKDIDKSFEKKSGFKFKKTIESTSPPAIIKMQV